MSHLTTKIKFVPYVISPLVLYKVANIQMAVGAEEIVVTFRREEGE